MLNEVLVFHVGWMEIVFAELSITPFDWSIAKSYELRILVKKVLLIKRNLPLIKGWQFPFDTKN
jgi:hypothetical protein